MKTCVVKSTGTLHAKLFRAMPGLVSFIYGLLQVKAIDTLTQLHCCEGSMIQDVNLKAFTDHSSRLLQQKQEKAQSTFFEGRA